jgi:glycosyltransferase involved in cell wall biosynthesis
VGTNYKISIVIAAYNVESYIIDCLDSIFKEQELLTFKTQVIVVNDGSKDETSTLLLSYIHDDLIILEQTNQGQSAARNNGLKYVQGEYLMFLDADDMLAKNALNILKNTIEEQDVDLVFFDAQEFYSELKKIPYKVNTYCKPPNLYNKKINSCDFFNISISSGIYNVSPCMYLVKASAVKEIKFKNGIIYEDNIYTTMVLIFSDVKTVFSIDLPLYKRRLREGSTVTEAKTPKHFNSYLSVYKELISHPPPAEVKKMYYKFCGNILALTAKMISEVKSYSFYKKLLLKIEILSLGFKKPVVLRFRLFFALAFGGFYKVLAFKIKKLGK